MKGRSSVMVGIRIDDAVNTIIKGLADKKGMTVSGFVKWKVDELAVNTTKEANHSVNKERDTGKAVNTTNGVKHSVNHKQKAVNTTIDRQGKPYKVIGGVRYYV